MKRLLFALLLPACSIRGEVLFDREASVEDSGFVTDTATPSDAPTGSGAWVSAGQSHSCAIRGGVLACWGDGANGRLGLGDEAARDRPTVVGGGGPFESVTTGDAQTCARETSGSILCFGGNDRGQLGLGDLTPRRTPVRVPLSRPATVVSAGYEVTCALLDDRSLVCWGENLEGQLGQADTYPGTPSSKPLRVGGDSDWSVIAAGQGHVCGIRAPGTLWCWGRNTDGQLGQGPGAEVQLRTPTRVGTESDWIAVDVGQATTCGLRADGSMWCFGDNGFGQVGTAPSSGVTTPRRVGADTGWVEVKTDTFHTCARKADGSLWCFGRNVEGQLGLGDTTDRSTPTRVGAATDWVQLDVGRFHTCARKTDGSIHCTGANADGELGLGDRDRRATFTRVVLPASAS